VTVNLDGAGVRVQPCAGGIVFDGAGRLLVIRRGHEPGAGLWSVPGGRCLPGESRADTCVREVAEETGLIVRVLRSAGTAERDGPPGIRYEIEDFVCAVAGGSLRAGDDADDARWVTAAELAELDLVPLLRDWLTEHAVLPR
jgi:ADP-ribose pyrophosphatase YjhB (NUDIX family)